MSLKFAKMRDGAIVPSKKIGDAGYDIYACFDEDMIVIPPHETVMIPTGIASAFDDDYVMVLKERGSTGTKGMGQRAGVIDASYRGEWLVPITNHNTDPIIITDLNPEQVLDKIGKDKYGDYWYDSETLIAEIIDGVTTLLFIPYYKSKAICQALLLPVPKVDIEEISYDELKSIKSERGDGRLGSSGK